MSVIQGRVGPWKMTWKSVPRGASGSAFVEVRYAPPEGAASLASSLASGAPAGTSGKDTVELIEVSWRRDSDGIWLEFPDGVKGFDLRGERDDDGKLVYECVPRGRVGGGGIGLFFSRAGDTAAQAQGSASKKGVRVRAQMPGKIIRVLVASGQEVQKGQPLVVMEAMKMENEIRSPQAGHVAQIKVAEGQAVESGADLLSLA